MRLSDYMWNIYELREKNPDGYKDIGIAADMLRTNIVHGVNGNPGTDLPWADMKAEWDLMTADQQSEARDELRRVMDECARLKMRNLYEVGDRKAFEKELEVARKNAADRKAAEEADKEAAEKEEKK